MGRSICAMSGRSISATPAGGAPTFNSPELLQSSWPAGFSQLVAVKELKPELAQDPSFVSMFLEEGRVAARFSHPNIVQTLETDQHDGRYFIAMEYHAHLFRTDK